MLLEHKKNQISYIFVHFMEEIWLHLSSTYLLQKMHKILYLSPCGCHGYSEIKGIDCHILRSYHKQYTVKDAIYGHNADYTNKINEEQ